MKKVDLSQEELNMIQALRNTQAQQGAANANSNNGSNENAEEKPKRRYKVQPVYKVLGKARRLFYNQVDKDADKKAKCIETALSSFDNLYPDALRFELDFRAERERLTDSKKFCDACEDLRLKPANVADHIVFEGKAVLEKVLKEGIQVVGEKVHMFHAPLWKDSQNLYDAAKEENHE